MGTNKIYDEYSDRYFVTFNLIGIDDNLIFCGVNDTGGSSLVKLNLIDYSTTHLKELHIHTFALHFL